ncbi:CDP-L-myo-inositol myo-inositolphosphotransferase [Desulfacinum hydrothermale DSM 13146]|uniref:CDP-L-myo-inositol myo-inositolphosphotransferase n=1 Tax=Desulfacinum hydrothermale DSM 13146 TaxID=1121390 RepID=A0A1W1XCM2_9BACT|nr:CDP-alcohol phosphatidyltransferase family protein [Desulfacinum hydrothermale]SMC21544.1 CDP-L-myo-inositol myo-inositolphosphotransferase [Desulfacinum hydrothermale DSM 13146]
MDPSFPAWQTKPTDRFVLKWIKVHLSARITPHLAERQGLEPWMITVTSATLGVLGGILFGLGWGFAAGWVAAAAQVLDGVDGQLARIKGCQSTGGAFWDSVLDRYADGAMVMGLTVYLARPPFSLPPVLLLFLGGAALIGSNLISYTTARAATLHLPMGPPTLASKGTRTSAMILSAWASLWWPPAPLVALVYLAVHTNGVVGLRLRRARGASQALDVP